MTRGRSGDRTYTGYNGAREATLRAKEKLSRSPGGVSGVIVRGQHFREMVLSQTCPYCGREFHNLGCHTNRAHGVSASELKELAGLVKGHSLASAEFSAKRSAHMKAVHEANPDLRLKLPELARKGGRTYSPAGMEVQRRKAAKGRAAVRNPYVPSAEDAARASRANADKHREKWAGLDRDVLRLFHQGELLSAIAAKVGRSTRSVKRSLIRSGITGDLRSLRGKRGPAA